MRHNLLFAKQSDRISFTVSSKIESTHMIGLILWFVADTQLNFSIFRQHKLSNHHEQVQQRRTY